MKFLLSPSGMHNGTAEALSCRRIPVWRYTDKQAILAAWGLGLYFGNHQIQDKLGQLISHVKVPLPPPPLPAPAPFPFPPRFATELERKHSNAA